MKELFAGEVATIDGPDVVVSELAYDSRQVVPGGLFVAIAGSVADGHAYVGEALRRGASCIVCERPVETGAATRVLVADARRTLARVASRFYGEPSERMTLVGVTGTNGKTTTTHLVESILRAAGREPGIVGTLGMRYAGRDARGSLTTPESLELTQALAAMLEAGVDALAMEVSSHALAQGRVAGVRFDVAAFTNLTRDHLDFHGSFDAYFVAKARLFKELLKPGGKAAINVDDPYGRQLAAELGAERVLAFSQRGDDAAAVRLIAHTMDRQGLCLSLQTPVGVMQLRSKLVGRFNIENIMAAASAALALGLDAAVIAAGIEGVVAVPGRLERVSADDEPLVLVDYAHTPDALQNALTVVRQVTGGRVVCVFGCGGDRDAGKRAPMGQAAAEAADLVVVTNDNPRSEVPEQIAAAIEAGLRAAGWRRAELPAPGAYAVELDRRAAIRMAVAVAQPRDAVLIAGKGHEDTQVIGGSRRHFDDRDEARAALAARRVRSVL